MKKPAAPTKTQAGFFEGPNIVNSINKRVVYKGTDNPRELRALQILITRPSITREAFDSVVGCANGPDLIKRLRDYGLTHEHLCCTRIHLIDRDGIVCRVGVYWMTHPGRRAVLRFLNKLAKKNG